MYPCTRHLLQPSFPVEPSQHVTVGSSFATSRDRTISKLEEEVRGLRAALSRAGIAEDGDAGQLDDSLGDAAQLNDSLGDAAQLDDDSLGEAAHLDDSLDQLAEANPSAAGQDALHREGSGEREGSAGELGGEACVPHESVVDSRSSQQ